MKRAIPHPSSFSVRLIAGLVTLVLLTTLSAGSPAYWLTRTQLERQAVSQVESMRQATVSLLQAEEERLANLALLLAERPTLRRLVSQPATAELAPYLAAFQMQSMLDILLYCGTDGRAWAGQPLVDECLAAGFRGILLFDGQPAVLASLPVTADGDGRLLGTALVGQWLDEPFLRQLAGDTGAQQTLLSDRGDRIVSSLPTLGESPGAAFPGDQTPLPHRISLSDSTYLVTYLPLTVSANGEQLLVEVALPVDDLVATERRALGILVASTGVVALVGIALATWYIRRMTRPLGQLTSIAREIAQGNFVAPIPSFSGPLEVATLAGALQRSHATMRQALGELAQARDWLNNLVQSIVEGVILFDARGRVTFLSQGAEALTGWSGAEAIGHPADQVVQVADGALLRDVAPAPGQKRRVEIVTRDGRTLTLAVTGAQLAPVAGEKPQTALVLRDVTEEEAGRHLRSYFLSSITHEFRTPLSALSASLQLLLAEDEVLTVAEMRELLRSSYLSLLSLQTLVDNLLESSKIEAGRFSIRRQPTDLSEIIAQATRIVQPLLERRSHALVLAGNDNLPLIQADGAYLTQVLVNLLTNAAKYSPIGASIDLHIERSDDKLQINVADRGPGIPTAERTNLFRRFVRLDSQEGEQYGIGLGLYVVKTTIEQHGGQVGVDDRPGGGSVFWVELPVGGLEGIEES
ncbi:MAG: PAS domain S-box protein [Caldilineaceae bacterium]|nr:PAS domain S-box protein [Caldilineaceae bacterium]